MPAALNLLNQKFGKLTVVSCLKERSKTGAIRWRCLCECGNYTTWNGGSLLYAARQTNYPLTCGCSKTSKRSNESYLNSKYNAYKQNAKKRNLLFALTKEQFYFLVQQNCYWCDAKPVLPDSSCTWTLDRGVPIETNGIDRYDNTSGYESTNCIPCCERCNKVKWDLSGQDFLDLIKTYHQKHFSKS
jgi:hypothetical protein